MNKQEFLETLEKRLSGFPLEDIEKSKEYYSEMIDDRVEDGLSEEEAVEALGNLDDIVSQIFCSTPLAKLVKEKVKPKRRLRAWEIVLIAVGSPLWLSLLLALIAVVLALYIIIWAFVITLYCVDLALVLVGPLAVVCGAGYLTTGDYLTGIFLIGCGFASIGLGIFMFLLCKKLTVLTAKLSKKTVLGIKSMFIRRKGE
ncbi:MAG: DUF1700 domain-containing protein [Ruminococcus sp.]